MKGFVGNILTIVLVAVLPACGGKGDSNRQILRTALRQAQGSAQDNIRKMPEGPGVPTMITDRTEAAEYLVAHFWNAFLEGDYLCDSTHVNGVSSGEVESAFVKYVTLLENNCTREFALRKMTEFFGDVEKYSVEHKGSNVFGFFEKTVPKYLYDPNSPMRDEDLYHPYVSRLASSALVDKDMKPAYSHDAAMCALNQVGTQATDFSFTDLSGRRHTLHGIKADYILLMFTNPGCDACHEVIETIKSNAAVPKLVKAGKLAVVNVYIDLEREKWHALAKEYPAEWYNGYDQDFAIRQDLTYSVRGIPSLYILDRDKKVIMKDAPTDKAVLYLQNIQINP